jgi:hypothetical protein
VCIDIHQGTACKGNYPASKGEQGNRDAHNRDASYIPAHKVFASLGMLYRRKGKVQRQDLKDMVDTIWNKCVLCERCYCFIGINIPDMISLARQQTAGRRATHHLPGLLQPAFSCAMIFYSKYSQIPIFKKKLTVRTFLRL